MNKHRNKGWAQHSSNAVILQHILNYIKWHLKSNISYNNSVFKQSVFQSAL